MAQPPTKVVHRNRTGVLLDSLFPEYVPKTVGTECGKRVPRAQSVYGGVSTCPACEEKYARELAMLEAALRA